MPQRFQYQAKAEVHSTQAEAVSLDRWRPTYPDRLDRQRALSIAVLAGPWLVAPILPPPSPPVAAGSQVVIDCPVQFQCQGLAQAYPEITAQPTSVDRWQPTPAGVPAPEYYPVVTGQAFVAPVPSNPAVQSECSVVIRSESAFQFQTRAETYPELATAPTPFTPQEISQPVTGVRRLALGEGVAEPFQLTRAETVSLDRFRPVYPDQLRRAAALPVWLPAQAETPAAPFDERVSLDKWRPTYPDRLERKPGAPVWLPSEPVTPIAPFGERITPDKWQPLYPDRLTRPVLHPSRLPGSFLVDFSAPGVETVTVDKWWQPLSGPVPRKAGLLVGLPSQPEVPAPPFGERLTLDKWRPTYPDRLPGPVARPHLSPATALVREAFAETVSLDRFRPVYPDWVRRRVYRPHLDPATALVQAAFAEAVSPDRWFQPVAQPSPRRATPLFIETVLLRVEAPAAPVTGMEWFRETEQPGRRRTVRPGLFRGTEPPVFPTLVTRWVDLTLRARAVTLTLWDRPSAAAAEVSDNFNRANADVLGTATTGQAWMPHLGTWGIRSQRAALVSGAGIGTEFVVLDTGFADGTLQATLAAVDPAANPHLLFRYLRNSGEEVDFSYLAICRGAGGGWALLRRLTVALPGTELASIPDVPAAGDVVKVVYSGTAIQVWLNGVQRMSVTDSTNLTRTHIGFGDVVASSGNRWDDLTFNAAASAGVLTLRTRSRSLTLNDDGPR